jgi:methanogenic corrinoid protein MtbC1
MKGNITQEAGAAVQAKQSALAEAVTARHYQLKPELETRYGAAGRAKCLQDAAYHLSYLSEALNAAQPSLFADYVVWARTMLAGRGIPEKDLSDNLIVLRESLAESLAADFASIACQYVDAGLRQINETNNASAPIIAGVEPLDALAASYLEALLSGRRDKASRMILETVESGKASIRDIYLQVFQKSQHEIGRLWQTNEISVAQEHYATAATQLVMSQLYPYIFSTEKKGRTVVATCVSGDLHEIGVRMVSDFFEMEGWDTFYLGANTPSSSLLQTLKERRADAVLLSATMTFHLRLVREIIEKIRADRETQHVKILVGGYPFNVAKDLWREIGADGFAADAAGAVEIANELLNGDSQND